MKLKLWGVEVDVAGPTMCASAGCISLALLLMFVALSFGELPVFQGFAKADEIEALQTGQGSIMSMLQELDTWAKSNDKAADIRAAHLRECDALAATKFELAQAYANQIEDFLIEYKDITGKDYSIRPCPRIP